MSKKLKQFLCLLLGGMMAFSVTACGDEEESSSSVGGNNNSNSSSDSGDSGDSSGSNGGYVGKDSYIHDPETRPVVFAIGALDNNFNPFFATSATDTEVIGMTQIGMLTTDSEGNPDCGEHQPTAVLDYKTTYLDANEKVTSKASMDGYTEYEFVIKNGIKFSDGKELTIKDVLFNLYVYLDPVYTGSSTIYSTDIVGLKAYQKQDATIDDSATSSDDYYVDAENRVMLITQEIQDKYDGKIPAYSAQVQTDINRIKELFKEELTSDWTSNYGTLESSYSQEYSFTHDWESYYFIEGLISKDTFTAENGSTQYKKDEDGKYGMKDYSHLKKDIENYVSANLTDKMAEGYTEETAKEELIKEKAINTVYDNYCGDDASGEANDSYVPMILAAWATGSNIRTEFAAEEKSKDLAALAGSVKSIKGITTAKTSDADHNNKFKGEIYGEKEYRESHDILKVRIKGVDPKAIWNFGFTIAPLHYYSGTYAGVDYVNGDGFGTEHFGVKFGDINFFNDVIKNADKSGLPVGAGVYMASNANGDQSSVDRTTFCKDNIVYYERNPYFYTTGIDNYAMTKAQLAEAKNDMKAEIHNARIKYFNYKVTSEDKILNALQSKNIDYGQPNATLKNINAIGDIAHLNHKTYLAGGYGYVGINPKFVPDLEVRQAIMKAMDTGKIIDYYTNSLAAIINRPMSLTSWAYPRKADGSEIGVHESITYDATGDEINDLLEMAGWVDTNGDGIRDKDGESLKIKFTIAGGTTDHPAYSMFIDAEALLEECGMDIEVGTDVQALKKLTTGDLAVWAAAWSSSIDPDPYQIYHMDSLATSTKNWNKDGIRIDPDTYAREYEIMEDLAKLIEKGRETLNKETRISIYAQAMDKIMEMAVEFPTYQRNDLIVYNKDVIDMNSLNQNPTYLESMTSKLWNMDFN